MSKATGVGGASASSAIRATRSGLTSCPTIGMARRSRSRRRVARVVRTFDRDGPAVGAGQGERQRGALAWPRVVEQQPDADGGLRRQPRLEGRDPVAGVDLDARRVGDRGGQRGRQVAWFDGGDGDSTVRRPVRSVLGAVGRSGCRRSRDRIEIERQLEATALGHRSRRPRRAPARRPCRARDARRRDRAVGGHATQGFGRVAGRLAGHRRQALDQRAELVLAEQPDDGLAVVVAEPRRLEVELHRQVADDRREVLAHEHRFAVLDELVAQLVRLDLVDPLVQGLERPELADELGRGLLPHPGHARDVVGGVALERLVIDHLAGHEVEALGDPGRVVQDRVLDAGARGHQPGVIGDELEHVEIAGHDRRVETAALGIHGDRPDDVVSLVAGQLVDGDAQRLDHLAHLRELVAQVVGHALAGGLVLGVLLVTEGRSLEVEGDRHVVGAEVLDAPEHDAAEAEHRVDELALGRRQGRESEVSAVDETVAIEQHEAFCGHG